MKRLNLMALALAVVAALALLGSTANADPVQREGSILIFPLFDASPGAGTVICATNTNLSTVYCPNTDFRVGDVLLHYLYIDGTTCLEYDRTELLTPGDTLCVVASEHNPEMNRGFLVVSARNPSDGTLLEFDALMGSAIVVQSDLNFLWSYKAHAFRSGADVVPSACADIADPDVVLGDGDGVPDYDGTEYEMFPLALLLDTFFEEGGAHGFTNRLTLMSTSGQDYVNEVNTLFFNNSEMKFSRTLKFTCWWSGPLSDISGVAANLLGDEEELGHQTETGWLYIEGNRILDLAGNPVPAAGGGTAKPAMLGVFMQAITATDFAIGRNLFGRGLLDAMEIEIGDGDPQAAP